MTALKLSLSVLLATALGVSCSHACGPFFHNAVLENRNANLLYLPEGSFAFESSRLVQADPHLPQWRDTSEDKSTAASAQESLLKKIRASGSLNAAEKMAASLPTSTRLYVLGAVAFANDDSRARDYFRKLLALPAEEQGEWGLKARYSLARNLMHDYPQLEKEDVYPLSSQVFSQGYIEELQEAFNVYQQVIDSVRNGQADPEQLSLASLGQQGRIKLWLGEPASATHLYAQQAAQGDPVGRVSLLYISNFLSDRQNENDLQQSIKDPLVQQLMVAYFFTHSSDPWDDQGKEIKRYQDDIVAKLVQVMNHDTPGSDRLIALAYRNGQYPLVTLLLKNAKENGLTSWVSAKMALRAGDVKSATEWYAKATVLFPVNEVWGNLSSNDNIDGEEFVIPACRIDAEQAVLALNRNDYLQAMRLMYNAKNSYWADLAWIAERVLTQKELITFVDKYAHVPNPPLSPQPKDAQSDTRYTADVKLRALLARRLMREGQYQKALAYFDIPEERKIAQSFIAALPKAGQKIANAQAWWHAALILREQGMTLTGYEMAPDFALYSGWYSWPYYEGGPEAPSPWMSAGEHYRVQQSLPKQDNHFMHYRWQAVKLAEKAVSLLPRKSQAYAAILCNATGWIGAQDPKTAKRLYHRYVKNGAQFPWAENFGQQCPPPEFDTLAAGDIKG